MDKNSNLYTIIYATVMVIVVAVVLALAASLLKERQQRNIELERKQLILESVHLVGDLATVPSKEEYIESQYANYITETKVTKGDKELDLYICQEGGATGGDDAEAGDLATAGSKYYIIPLRGAGLWGPIWGYISLHDDFNKIYGAVFDHEGETPGLGAEIATIPFYSQFSGKEIFTSDGEFISVKVAKGRTSAGKPHQIDGITGGTITSEAVEEMIYNCLQEYLDYFKQTLQNQ